MQKRKMQEQLQAANKRETDKYGNQVIDVYKDADPH